jgi:hypothetical protein
VARELEASLAVLGAACEELDRRQAAFAGAGVETLAAWNEALPAEALPYVLVVDECAELSAGRSERGASKRSRISRVSAAWGGRPAST